MRLSPLCLGKKNSNKRRCSELGDAVFFKMNVTLKLGKVYSVYLFIIYNSQNACCNKRHSQELAQHAGMQRCCQFTQMTVAMVVHTFVALIGMQAV